MNNTLRMLKEHIWGPTGSLIFHAIVLVILVRYLVFEPPPDEETIVIQLEHVPPPPEPLEEIEPDLRELDQIPDVVEAVDIPTVTPEHEPPVLDHLEAAPSPFIDPFDIRPTHTPVVLPGLIAGRTADGRGEGLGRYAGRWGQLTEAAVMRALRWLKDHQYPDGSWGPNYRASMTGLALLCFLAHGETTNSEEFGESVRRGLLYLLSCQDERGWYVGGGPGLSVQVAVYEHVIAAYAMAEAYAMTAIPMLRPSVRDAVRVMVDSQLENGGWAYNFASSPVHIDVSLGGWIIQALKAADMARIDVRGLKMAIENGIRGLRTMTDPAGSGMFAYSGRIPNHRPDHIMTGVAVLALQLTGYVRAEEALGGMRALRPLNFEWRTGDRAKVGQWPLYAWYYITQARFQFSRESWTPWNEQMAPGLVGMQNPDGSWCAPPGSTEERYGPVYCTTFPALMLMVYYRLLPTFQPVEDVVPTDLTDTDPDARITVEFED